MKYKTWIFETFTKLFILKFRREVDGNYSLKVFCRLTKLSANSVCAFYGGFNG